MDVFDLYPRQVYTHLFEEAYHLHVAACEVYRLQNIPRPADAKPEVTAQRNAILKIASQLIILERNKLLDIVCVDWLRYRKLPTITRDNEAGKNSVGLRDSSESNAGVQAEVRNSETQAGTVHDRGAATGAQPSGGEK